MKLGFLTLMTSHLFMYPWCGRENSEFVVGRCTNPLSKFGSLSPNQNQVDRSNWVVSVGRQWDCQPTELSDAHMERIKRLDQGH